MILWFSISSFNYTWTCSVPIYKKQVGIMLIITMEEPKVCFKRVNSFMSQEAFHAISNQFRNFFSYVSLKLFLKPQKKQERTAIIQDRNHQHSEINQTDQWWMGCWEKTVISNADLKPKKKVTKQNEFSLHCLPCSISTFLL